MIITATYQSESRPTLTFDVNPNLSGADLGALKAMPITTLVMGTAAVAGVLVAFRAFRNRR
jgi:hypothetical protein